MISYEIAKKLKEIGFSQKGDSRFCFTEGNPSAFTFEIEYWHNGTEVDRKMLFPENPIYIPLLSELIEACKKTGWDRHFEMGGCESWWAVLRNETNQKAIVPVQLGETPEEAVANLWLKLQDKE